MAEELGKMKFLAKFELFLFSLLLLGIGILLLGFALGWMLPLDQLIATLRQAQGKWLIGLAGAVLVFLGLISFFDNLKSAPTTTEGVTQELKLGRVITTVQALESVVHKAVRQVRGVREVKPVIRVDAAGLVIILNLVLAPEVKISEIAEQIQENVKNQINQIVGIEVLEVRIRVENIGYDANARVE